jgi:large subunit ribosomal protein L22
MEAKATVRYVRISPQKVRLVVDLIRGKQVGRAIDILRFTKKRGAKHVEKLLHSAIANAQQKEENVDVDELYVKKTFVNEGARLKRIRPAPMGRAYRYQRRMAHITVELAKRGGSEENEE